MRKKINLKNVGKIVVVITGIATLAGAVVALVRYFTPDGDTNYAVLHENKKEVSDNDTAESSEE